MPPTQDRNKSTKNHRNSGKFGTNGAKRHLSKAQSNKTSRGLVRIIAGTHRGRRLPVLVSDGLRPTSDRVKETLFNWLMSDIANATCLDMYAGSGGLGIEALSRGAQHVTFIEQDRTVVSQVEKNISTLRETDNSQVICASALLHEFAPSTQFDIVFIDPPFAHDMVEKSIDYLQKNNLLKKNAHIYIETGHNDSYGIPAEFTLLKSLKTSQVNACLFELDT